MEQVAEHHGSEIGAINVLWKDDVQPSRKIIILPKTPEEFDEFPNKYGWKINESFRLEPQTPKCDLAVFLQAWLFFGLAFTIVRTDKEQLLYFENMIEGRTLSTRNLQTALERWSEWEKAPANCKGLRLRMVQVGSILDRARHVLRKNCAYIDGQVWYSQDITERLHIEDELVLVLMCLGETLCEFKAKIVDEMQVGMAGWHPLDEREGWGPPRHVFMKMEEEGWCPRAMRLLKGQFNSNATMLIAAYYAYKKSERMTKGHKMMKCTPEECFVKSMDDKGIYRNMHLCEDKTNTCESFGPDQEKIMRILGDRLNKIPLLRFSDEESTNVEFEVIEFDPKGQPVEFVAISHVWSDGWGNETVNELNRCQLRFIQRQIKLATNDYKKPFWMDTLVVPVGVTEEIKAAKKKAIRQISDVFYAASSTIIIDNGLFAINPGKKPAEIAYKIMASVWMRRLWTLQEAYLSRTIYFIFKESRGAQTLVNLKQVEDDLAMSGITQRVRDQLSQIVMGQDRWKRLGNKSNSVSGPTKLTKKEAARVVTNAWRAARWRSTSQPEHETLALATLLNLDFEGTIIEEAGLLDPNDKTNKDETRGQKLVEAFWERVRALYPGAIPSGIIFLPGEKVNISGYGWAPKTWLSAHEVDYPEPMNIWNTPTELGRKGLQVNYPGFVLHTDSSDTRSAILGTATVSDWGAREPKISFPSDRTLSEWYSFTKAKKDETCPEITRLENAKTKLALILSRPSKESPRDIALLVEICEETPSPDEDNDPGAVDYYVRIIHQVYIWRLGQDHLKPQGRSLRLETFTSTQTRDFPVAEMLGTRQRWWVDGYITKKVNAGPLARSGGGQAKPADTRHWTSLLWGRPPSSKSAQFAQGRKEEPVGTTPVPAGGWEWVKRTWTGRRLE